MISSILLLVVLTASVCGKLFMNVNQTFYHAAENSNIMMKWIFTPNMILTDLNIYCAHWLSDHKTSKTLYHLQKGADHPESQHEQFAGRVRFDKNDFIKGNIRLHLSRLRINDSGLYQCEVFTDHEGSRSECLLNVTAARIQSTAEETKTSSRGRIGLFVGSLGLFLLFLMFFTLRGQTSSKKNLHSLENKSYPVS